MLPKTSPNYLQYKIHKRWLLSWIHVIVIIRVTTCECFKMQMVINLAPVSLSNKKVNFYTCPRLTFVKRNTTDNAYKRISEPLDYKSFWGGGMPSDPLTGSHLLRSKIASSCSEVWLRPWLRYCSTKNTNLLIQVLNVTRASIVIKAPSGHQRACGMKEHWHKT